MGLRFLFSLAVIFLSLCEESSAQGNITFITPSDLFEKTSESAKSSVVQFWVPNCENAVEIIEHYQNLERNYEKEVDFYFLGITDKEELLRGIMDSVSYEFNMYIIDPAIEEDLIERRGAFAKEFSHLVANDREDFLTLFMGGKNNLIYRGNLIVIEDKNIEELLEE